jgi:hypothetical protein
MNRTSATAMSVLHAANRAVGNAARRAQRLTARRFARPGDRALDSGGFPFACFGPAAVAPEAFTLNDP